MAAAGANAAKIEKLIAHANECVARYDIEAAIKFYEKAVQLEPLDTNLLDAAGELCIEVGRSADAIDLFGRSIQLKPDENSCKYMNLGQLMAGHECLAHFNKGMELMYRELAEAAQKEDAEGHAKLQGRICHGYCSMTELYMTDLCDEEGAEQKCEEFLTKAQGHKDDSPELWVQWANLRLCQCRPDDARKFTYKAVSLSNKVEEGHPNKPSLEVRTGMMKLLIELEQLDEAEEFGNGLLEVDDQYLETWYLLALIHFNRQDYSNAHQCTASALRILEAEGVEDEEQASKIQEQDRKSVV